MDNGRTSREDTNHQVKIYSMYRGHPQHSEVPKSDNIQTGFPPSKFEPYIPYHTNR